MTADADYIRESIFDPNAKVMEGFPPAMMAAVLSGFQDQLESQAQLTPSWPTK